MSDGGWIKLNRKALEHPLFAGHPERLGAWAWLLLRAAWRPTRQDVAGQIITVERGQIVTSYRQLASAWGWSVKAVRTFIAKLEAEGGLKKEITAGSSENSGSRPVQSGSKTGTASRGGGGTGRLLLTICKYEVYQSSDMPSGTAPEAPTGTAGAQQGHSRGTEKEEEKKGRREKEGRAQARAARLPADWTLPDDWKAYALSIGLDEVSIKREALEFSDYWHAEGGQKARKVDWKATWQRWARRALEDRRRRPGAGSAASPDDWRKGLTPAEIAEVERKAAERRRQQG